MIDIILRPFRIYFGTDKRYYRAIHDIFGIYPDNIELYKLALIHRSASVILDDGTAVNNERLEFLGDAVLESIVSDYLFIEFPQKSEGFLTQLRSKIVSRATLNRISIELGLDRQIVVQSNAMHAQKHLFGDAFEAMIGAIYLDKGYNFVNRLMIDDILKKRFNINVLLNTETDFKSRVIEWVQKHHKNISFSTVPSGAYTDCNPQFVATINIDEDPVGCGEGASKKEAEQTAAEQLLLMIRKGELQY